MSTIDDINAIMRTLVLNAPLITSDNITMNGATTRPKNHSTILSQSLSNLALSLYVLIISLRIIGLNSLKLFNSDAAILSFIGVLLFLFVYIVSILKYLIISFYNCRKDSFNSTLTFKYVSQM